MPSLETGERIRDQSDLTLSACRETTQKISGFYSSRRRRVDPEVAADDKKAMKLR